MIRLGPSSLAGLSRKAGLRSRWALGHYRAGELGGVAAVVFCALATLAAAALILAGKGPLAGLGPGFRAAVLAAAAAGTLCVLYAVLVEPGRLVVRRVGLASPKVSGEPLRILHASDLHVRRWGGIEERVLAEAASLEPDLILLTGDYTAHPCVAADAGRLIAGLAAIAPTFACRGNGDYRPPPYAGLFEGTRARVLLNETVELEVRGARIALSGFEPGHEEKVVAAPEPAPGRLSVCLYHYPDLVPRLRELPFDLMLCGHTHGGQVRLPLLGAVISFSRAGTGFARGLFSDGGRHAVVTQGVGAESYGLLSLRFLCPPELVLITIGPA